MFCLDLRSSCLLVDSISDAFITQNQYKTMSKRSLPSHSPDGRRPSPMSSKRLCFDTSPPSGPVPTFALASVPRRPVLPVPRGIHGGVSKPGFKFWYDQRGHPLPFRRLCSLPMPKLLPLLPLDDEAGQSLRQTTTITDAESLEMYYKMIRRGEVPKLI